MNRPTGENLKHNRSVLWQTDERSLARGQLGNGHPWNPKSVARQFEGSSIVQQPNEETQGSGLAVYAVRSPVVNWNIRRGRTTNGDYETLRYPGVLYTWHDSVIQSTTLAALS